MSALFSVVGAWIAPSSRQGRSDQKLAKPSGFLLPPDFLGIRQRQSARLYKRNRRRTQPC